MELQNLSTEEIELCYRADPFEMTRSILKADLRGLVNDSGFWLVNRFFGLTEKQTLQTWTVMETIIGFVGFGVVFLISFFV